MLMGPGGPPGYRRRRSRRDFWQEWSEERRSHWEDCDSPPCDEDQPGFRPPAPPEVAREWRKFFHEFTGAWPEDHWAFSGRRFSPWHQGQASFNPFVASILSKGGGLLPLYVLHLLSQKPRYGNEIMDLITEQTAGQWGANPGAIYPLMNTLEEQGLIEGTWDDPTRRTVRVYNLTEFGDQEVRRLKAIVRPKLIEAIKVMQNLVENLNAGEEEP
ncbi:MAG: PadR family transcriptional regulator [Anaerolineae bacterium]|nr:PadR family transcriptional regulator [Anaerolineae bacterium]